FELASSAMPLQSYLTPVSSCSVPRLAGPGISNQSRQVNRRNCASVDGRVAPGSCTPRPSRPGESHPEALTDPCLSLSAHTARAIHGELAPSVTTRRFLPLPVDQSGYDANDPPPSLHGHYSTS